MNTLLNDKEKVKKELSSIQKGKILRENVSQGIYEELVTTTSSSSVAKISIPEHDYTMDALSEELEIGMLNAYCTP